MCEGNTSLILLNLWAKSDSVTIQLKPLSPAELLHGVTHFSGLQREI